MYKVLSPLGESRVEAVPPAPRLPDLRGKTICEVTNASFKSEVTFPIIRELLQKRYPDIRVIPHTEFPIHYVQGSAKEMMQWVDNTVALLLEKGCDAVIAGNGG